MSRSIRGSTYQKNPLDFRGEKGAAIDALRHGASLRHHCIGNRKMSPAKASVFHTALLDRSADVPQTRSRGGEFPREEFISPIRGSNQEEQPQGVVTQKQDARIACLAFQPTALSLRLRWQQLFFCICRTKNHTCTEIQLCAADSSTPAPTEEWGKALC